MMSHTKQRGGKISRNVIRDDRGEIMKLYTRQDFEEFLRRFSFCRAKGGFRKYLTSHGPTCFEYINSLRNQAILKTVLVLVDTLTRRDSEGDTEAKAMLEGLKGFLEKSRKDR